MKQPSVLFIVGPTAVGKTALSVKIAEKTGAEIISADSRQIYKYLDIGTAKVEDHLRQKIPHYLIDIRTPDQYFSAGQFADLAREIIRDIINRGKLPVVVGGSGLYIRALIDGFFSGKVRDESIRRILDEELGAKGLEALYQELMQVDPAYALKISPNDPHRILRALEVYRATGKPFTDWHKKKPAPAFFRPVQFGLTMERSLLYQRINQRVDEMLKFGLIDEVQKILQMGFSKELNALNTVGYKEVIQYINQEISYSEMLELIKRHTRQFAKRQLTWFKKDKRINWLDVSHITDWDAIAEKILKELDK